MKIHLNCILPIDAIDTMLLNLHTNAVEVSHMHIVSPLINYLLSNLLSKLYEKFRWQYLAMKPLLLTEI